MSETPKDNEQGQLFKADQPAPEFDASVVAEHIGKHAGKHEYPDRTSEAARDQGHGPQTVIGIEEVAGTDAERTAARRRGTHPSMQPHPLREMPRQGANNQPKVRFDPDTERVEAAKRGINAARKMLHPEEK